MQQASVQLAARQGVSETISRAGCRESRKAEAGAASTADTAKAARPPDLPVIETLPPGRPAAQAPAPAPEPPGEKDAGEVEADTLQALAEYALTDTGRQSLARR